MASINKIKYKYQNINILYRKRPSLGGLFS